MLFAPAAPGGRIEGADGGGLVHAVEGRGAGRDGRLRAHGDRDGCRPHGRRFQSPQFERRFVIRPADLGERHAAIRDRCHRGPGLLIDGNLDNEQPVGPRRDGMRPGQRRRSGAGHL